MAKLTSDVEIFSARWPKNSSRARAEAIVRRIQEKICQGVLALEAGHGNFMVDPWNRENQCEGGGISCVLQDGAIFEKAGVNVSVISSTLPASAIASMRANHAAIDRMLEQNGDDSQPLAFFAAGVSVVIHPHNPFAPTMHCNYRYFEVGAESDAEPKCWWVGGGTDLTPCYLFEEDCVHFHSVQKRACDKIDTSLYSKFKKWCDTYFYLKHRQEARGIGGIFFDDLDSMPLEQAFEFIETCGLAVNDAYFPIVDRRKDTPFTEEQKRWQQLRRGRYVEFNLIWDRGTQFGLHTPNARIESILMSLPLTCRWEYMVEPEKGSPESELVDALRQPRDWIPLQ